MSERQANTPTLRALLPSRLVPEDMLSEWQGPNLPNTKNYAPPPDSMRGRMGDVLMQGIAALGGFTGLPMGGEESKAALLGELLAAGMPLVGGVKALRGVAGAKKLPYKAARESLRDVADANFGYGIPVGNRTVNIDTLRGGMSAAADDAAKVNKIAQQMSSKDGYIERLIVDQNGNVIEGQHRLRALQSLGVQDVPVSVIQDYSDVVETLQKQGMRPEHARQVTQQTHDMLKDSGSAAKVRSDYNLSGQYEAQFESALDLMDAPKATTRLYRVEPKDLGDKGEWLKKHIPPEQYNQFVNERGRLFADDLAISERFGHGSPDNNTFVVDVPADVAAAAKRSHRDGYSEFLLPSEVVAGKRPFKLSDAPSTAKRRTP